MKIAALILAAGESRRMGRPKALLPIRDKTFVQNLITLMTPYCDPIVVVLGHNPDPIRVAVGDTATVVINSNYRLGQFSSMQTGLASISSDVEGIVFTLVDHPDPSPSTIEKIISLDAPVSIPIYYGRKGHPVFFRSDVIEEFMALSPDSQANIVARRHSMDTRLVPVDDPAILEDIDDAEALRHFRERLENSRTD